jgi:hypothetical protein
MREKKWKENETTMMRTEESLSCLIKENSWHRENGLFPFVTKDGTITSE